MPKESCSTSPPAKDLVSCFRCEHYVIAVETASHLSKMFQIMFQKKDGTLFVNFPYFKKKDGIVSVIPWGPDKPPPENFSLESEGKLTSHLVKYSHHPDGRAHFSQTKKVRTEVKKQSIPLDEIQGHLFTVQLQGFKFFEPLGPESDIPRPTVKKRTLKFSFGSEEAEAIKFVGRLFTQDKLQRNLNTGTIGSQMTFTNPNGQKVRGFLCSSPPDHAGQGRILL